MTQSLEIHPTQVHGTGDTMGNFGTQVSSGGQRLENVGNRMVSSASSDRSGVGSVLVKALTKGVQVAGKVFSEGGRVCGEAGQRLHLCASNHEANEESVASSIHHITSPGDDHINPHAESGSPVITKQPSLTKPMTPPSAHDPGATGSSSGGAHETPPHESTPPSPHPDTDTVAQDYKGNPDFRSSEQDRANFKNSYSNYNDHVDAVNEAKANNPALANIPEEDLVAVRSYTTNDHYDEMNKGLRNNDPDLLKQYDSHIRTTTSGLNQLPKAGYTTVTRTIAVDQKDMPGIKEKYGPDNTVTEDGFFSATKGNQSGFWGGVTMQVDSDGGRILGPLSSKTGENEVLFPPGMQHVVTSQKWDPNTNALKIYSEM
jgi:hypothetical protein